MADTPIIYDASDFEAPSGYAGGTIPVDGQYLFPWSIGEINPILSWPQSTRMYSLMRYDSQIEAATRAMHLTLRKLDWRIDPGGAPDAFVQALAEDLGLPVLGAEESSTPQAATVPFLRHLAQALEVTTYGHMPFEITVKVEDKLTRLARLDVRHPQTLTRIITDGQNEVTEIWQAGVEPMPGARICWYKIGGVGEPQGVSLLRSVYKPWKLKDEFERLQAISMKRNSLGMPTISMPSGATQAEYDAAETVVTTAKSGDAAGLVIPGGGKFSFEGVHGTLPNVNEAIQHHQAQTAKALLEMFLELGTSSTGSHALGEVQIDLFRDACQATADELAEQFTTQVIKRLAEWTYGVGAACPRLVPGTVGDDNNLPPATISILAQAGIITADTGLEVHIRQQYGLPEMDADTVHVIPPIGTKGGLPPLIHADQPGAANFSAGDDPKARALRGAASTNRHPAGTARAATVTEIGTKHTDAVQSALSDLYGSASSIAESVLATWPGGGQDHARAYVAAMLPGLLDATAKTALTTAVQAVHDDGIQAGADAAPTAVTTSSVAASVKAMQRNGVPSGQDLKNAMPQDINDISDTRAYRLNVQLSKVLAEGGTRDDLEHAAWQVIGNADNAETIARTEASRAFMAGKMDQWNKNGGVTGYIWDTDHHCDICAENQDASPIDVGEDWPEDWPPVHPNCECDVIALVASDDGGDS